ncbi:LysE family translocator [Saccharospirillum impatiens]|uniref:LysE family translocator n=1 Tax=Saccharospirillum impatiens TaxID=169438 RepID=UPI00048AE5BD|nr:LysE family transporter [Saccharospirillum impatiens]
MTWTTWLAVVSICMLGAMSPGPSLAVVLKQTLAGGRSNGVVVAVTHGLGIGLYALLSIFGLAALITASPLAFTALQWSGALYLAWLGVKGLRARANPDAELPDVPTTASAARDGFLVVFLNPKVAVFFIALFSQVVGADTSVLAKLGYAATAMVIDGSWYLVVAWLFSTPAWLDRLKQHSVWFERVFGVILVALAGRLVLSILR